MNGRTKAWLRQWLPRTLRPQWILAGPLRGRRIVTSWHDYPAAVLGRTERPLLAWFAKNVQARETWLDVGAQYGYTAIALSRLVGEQGRVFAFEPMIATAGCLAQTRRLNRLQQLTVVPLALAEPDSLAVLELPTVRGMVDSTLRPAAWQETFLAARLDWLWPQICGHSQRIDGVKIDVQGMELATLRGMSGVLTTHHPKLVVEFHRGVDRPAVLAVLANAGYRHPGEPMASTAGEVSGQYRDDRSYAFCSS
jgi:FkbM family methyltransferase